jgi:hypothetical protein
VSSPLVLLISGLALVGVAALMRRWSLSQKPRPQDAPVKISQEDDEIVNADS